MSGKNLITTTNNIVLSAPSVRSSGSMMGFAYSNRNSKIIQANELHPFELYNPSSKHSNLY